MGHSLRQIHRQPPYPKFFIVTNDHTPLQMENSFNLESIVN